MLLVANRLEYNLTYNHFQKHTVIRTIICMATVEAQIYYPGIYLYGRT